MKKILFLLGIICLAGTGHAQITVISAPGANHSVFSLGSFGHWPLMVPGDIPSYTNKRSAFVLEYPDGYFTTNNSTAYAIQQRANAPAVLSLSGRYDTIKPPPLFAKYPDGIMVDPNFAHPTILNPNELVRLTPIASNITPKDEMLYILTYKVPQGAGEAAIVFFYNSHASTPIFDPVNFSSKIENANTADASLLQVNRVRKYFGESDVAVDDASYTNLPPLARLLQRTDYGNNLVWKWNNNDNRRYEEHNVFISLRTNDVLPTDAPVYVEAALLYSPPAEKGKTTEISAAVSTLRADVSLLPHDPNFILASPRCIELVAGTAEKPVNFHIRTQNEGLGAAYRLEIVVNMDKAIIANMANFTTNSFKAIVAGKEVDVDQYEKLKGENKFKIVFNDLSNNKIDSRNDLSLRGSDAPNWTVNPETYADIYFTVNVPVNKPADFVSFADIIFFDGNHSSVPYVRTAPDTLHIREHCSNLTFPNETKINPDNGCTKWGPLCWYWWIAIVVGILILLWIIARRRKRNQDEVNY